MNLHPYYTVGGLAIAALIILGLWFWLVAPFVEEPPDLDADDPYGEDGEDEETK